MKEEIKGERGLWISMSADSALSSFLGVQAVAHSGQDDPTVKVTSRFHIAGRVN